jgi:hypothetical protein
MPFDRFRAADDATAAAVSRLLPDLAPAAVLIADDADDAVRLLGVALGSPGALDDVPSARRALIEHLDARPRWSAEQVIETAGPPADTDDDDAALAAALRALPERQRAAVVLAPADGAEEAVVRLRADVARRDADELLESRRAAALFRAPGSAPPAEPAVVPLPERLDRLAAGRPLPPAAAEAIAALIGEAQGSRRRRRLRFTAGAAVAALLVALTPLLPQGAESPPTVYGEPTRGTLAVNEDFVAGMSEAAWPGAPGPTDSRRVVFADDVPGGRWALVAAGGNRSQPAAIAWFTGPSGASPDEMTLWSVRSGPDPAMPVSLTDPTTGALVVVGAPGDRITVSARPDVGPDGSVTRSFRTLRAPDGVAVAGLTPVPDATVSAARLQVSRENRLLAVRPRIVIPRPAGSAADLPVRALRPANELWVGDAAVNSRLRTVFGQLGQVAAATPVTALWSGDLPGVNDRPTRLSILAIQQASGAFVVTAPYSYAADPRGRLGSSWCATGVLPAGLPLEQRAVAVRCDLRDQLRGEIYRFLVVVGPRTATTVQLLDDAGAVLSEHPLADGVAVIRSPGDVIEVSVSTAAGGSVTGVPFVDSDLAD